MNVFFGKFTRQKEPLKVLYKKVSLKISQNSQKNFCVGVFYLKNMQILIYWKRDPTQV